MPAYIFFDILEITYQEKTSQYGSRIRATVEHYGGRYFVRGGNSKVLEGDWGPVMPIIIEFPSFEQAEHWYESDEYKELRALRIGAMRVNAVMIEGVSSP